MKRFFRNLLAAVLLANAASVAASQSQSLLNEPVDINGDFHDFSNTYFLADKLANFNPTSGEGKIIYQRAQYSVSMSFNNMQAKVKAVGANEFPQNVYPVNPSLPFSIQFVSPRTIRIRMASGAQFHPSQSELMLAGDVPTDNSWKYEKISSGHRYTGQFGSVIISENPFHIEIRDASGNLLTKTEHERDTHASFSPILPFSFVRRASDLSRSFNAAFTLSYGEKIFGCGESFTDFDKRGQKIILCTTDGMGVESRRMYKPIPFFMSNRGYGVFMH